MTQKATDTAERVKLTPADYRLLEVLDFTPRFVSGDFTALVARGHVERIERDWINAPLYALTESGARLRRWYHNT